MAGYTPSNFVRDPINRPDHIPLDEWYTCDLKMVAECLGCGRTREVHTGELIRRFGYGMLFTQFALDNLAPKIKCISCERRSPKLTLEVRKG